MTVHHIQVFLQLNSQVGNELLRVLSQRHSGAEQQQTAEFDIYPEPPYLQASIQIIDPEFNT